MLTGKTNTEENSVTVVGTRVARRIHEHLLGIDLAAVSQLEARNVRGLAVGMLAQMVDAGHVAAVASAVDCPEMDVRQQVGPARRDVHKRRPA